MRKAFTLIELMIAITLTALLLTLLYKSADTIVNGGEYYAEKEKRLLQKTQKIQKLLILDLLGAEAGTIQILNREPDEATTVLIHTTNSLHRIPYPWILYKKAQTGELLRIETPNRPKLPLNSLTTPNIAVDQICKNIQKFKIFKKKEELLLAYKCDQNKLMITRLLLLNTK
ncbi:MAG TPA: prepilin-type N-terminal cleavage/methylation domain-containing protein [Sulfurimonas autotrophica]|nr:prepilin-type N-terminal cleavage/methylation domain-containing protein [Sulfurimonas autotrophica]